MAQDQPKEPPVAPGERWVSRTRKHAKWVVRTVSVSRGSVIFHVLAGPSNAKGQRRLMSVDAFRSNYERL